MIKDFVILNCIGEEDKIGLKFNNKFYIHDFEQKIRNNEDKINNATTDFTKWELIDQVGNVFNRLVLFNAHHFHTSMDYFGSNPGDGRLFQVFFFSTEREFC